MRTATALLTLFAFGCSGDGDPVAPTDTEEAIDGLDPVACPPTTAG